MKKLIFDYDGVILDSFPTVLRELGKLHQKYNLPVLTEDLLVQLFDGNFWENHKNLGLSEENERELKEKMKQALIEHQTEMPIFSGIKEALQKLSVTNEIIILSSNHAETILARLEDEELRKSVTTVLGTETPGNKQDKMKKFIDNNDQALIFITDTKGDILEVKDLKITTIAVTWGFHNEDRLSSAGPTKIVHSPQELIDTLQADM